MKVTSLGYLIKEGLRGIFGHGFMSFAAVCVTVACLLIVGTFSSLMYNVNIMVEELNMTNEVMAYVDKDMSDAEARSVGTQINRIENISSATFVSREEALEDFVSSQDNPETFEGVDPLTIEHRYVVVLKDNRQLDTTVEALEAVDGVVEVRALTQMAAGFASIQDALHILSLVIIAILLVVSLLIISNTVKLAMYDRREEIAIMKMVGATNGFIRMPFVVEGFTLGMIGAAIAFGLDWLLYDYMVKWIGSVDTLSLFNFVPFTTLLVPMIITFAAAGMFVGIVGSWTSIRKFMNV